MSMNAASTLLENGDAQRTAIACGADRVTYGTLRASVARAASVWRRRGLGRGERVALKLTDSPAWVEAFLSTLWAGGVSVAVNPRIPAEDWQYILGERPFRFILAESPAEVPPEFGDSVIVLDEWLREIEDAPALAPEAVEEDTPAFWTHSSGTSGRPKAVVHAHRFALSVDAVARELLECSSGDRFYATSKLFFAYPLGNSLFAGLKLGGTVILDSQWPTAPSVAATVAAQKPTVFFSVPSLYRNLLKSGLAPQLVENGVRVFVSAGEALAPSLREEWRRQTGFSIVNGYGASETLSLVLLNPGEGEDLSPTPGFEVQPLELRDNAAPTRIRIASRMLALGYWNRPEADAQSFRDSAFCPADLFQRTGANAWRFAGREDSLVKIRGRWVDLADLEERIAIACPSLAEAAATSTPDDDGVASIAFFYVLKPDAPPGTESALNSFVETFLAPYQRPRWLRSVPSLPRTPTGKLLRRKLLEMYPLRAADAAGSTVAAAV